jgi:hypothetical protein
MSIKNDFRTRICPICKKPHYGTYGTGLYCRRTCARAAKSAVARAWHEQHPECVARLTAWVKQHPEQPQQAGKTRGEQLLADPKALSKQIEDMNRGKAALHSDPTRHAAWVAKCKAGHSTPESKAKSRVAAMKRNEQKKQCAQSAKSVVSASVKTASAAASEHSSGARADFVPAAARLSESSLQLSV